MEIEITGGLLTKPTLHDARATGLIMHNDDLHVIVKPTEGPLIKLIMRCVYRLIANNFREGNIVLDIEVIERGEVELSDLRIFYVGSEKAAEHGIKSLYSTINSDNKLLVKLNASYGCELACICSRIEICELGTANHP